MEMKLRHRTNRYVCLYVENVLSMCETDRIPTVNEHGRASWCTQSIIVVANTGESHNRKEVQATYLRIYLERNGLVL